MLYALAALLAFAVGGLICTTVQIKLASLRDSKGLYDQPIWVQRLICWSEGIPQEAVGLFASQQDSVDFYWAHIPADELNDYGLAKKAEAQHRLGMIA